MLECGIHSKVLAKKKAVAAERGAISDNCSHPAHEDCCNEGAGSEPVTGNEEEEEEEEEDGKTEADGAHVVKRDPLLSRKQPRFHMW